MLKNISIKKKLYLFVIIVFAVSTSVATIYTTISFKNSSKKVSKNTAKLINDRYITVIKTEIEKGISNLQSLSVISQTQEIEKTNKINNTIVKYIKLKDEISDFFIILDNKKLNKTSSNKDSIKPISISIKKTRKGTQTSIYNETDFRFNFRDVKLNASKNKFLISEPFITNNIDDKLLAVTISKPILINNKIVGAIGINYSLSVISELINSITKYDDDAKLILLTENKNIIFVSQKPWLSGKNLKNSQIQEQQILSQIKNNNFNNIRIKNYTGVLKKFKISNTNTKWQIALSIPFNVFITDLISDVYISIIIATFIMILGLFIVIFFIKKSFSPIEKILSASQKISLGEPVNLKVTNNNTEFGKIATSFNIISSNIEEAAKHSSKIANGNYDLSITPKSKKDILSISINKIVNNLKEAKQKSIAQEKNTFKQLWMRKGMFEVAEAERKSDNNIYDLTFNLLREIANYTGAIIGGLYLYNSDEELIELYASYAYENKKHINKTFKLGEGLIGTSVLEQKRIVINDVPDEYISIVSGLGSRKPANICIIPFFYQEKINAVIELAFIQKPKDYVIEFIENLGDNIGAWIDASLINLKTANLLKVSRKQTEELAEKENELNLKVEELEKIKSEIDKQNIEYKSMMNAINHTVMTVEYTLEGIVINSNAKYEEIMGYSLKEIKGRNVLDLVKDQKENLKHIIEEVSKGNPVKQQVKRYTKTGQEKLFSATYTPYYNEENKITKVLFFAHDITNL